MFGKTKRAATTSPPTGEFRCSFCNKSQRYVQQLIAGPNQVYICDECVDICQNMLHASPEEVVKTGGANVQYFCGLCRLPVAADESLYIRERGVLCPGCVGEIEASLEERAATSRVPVPPPPAS